MNQSYIESQEHDIGIHAIDGIEVSEVSESQIIDMLKSAEYYLDFDIDWSKVSQEFKRVSRECAERYMARTPED